MRKSTLTSKSQTTVPKEVRERLGIGPGDVLLWEEEEGGSFRVTPVGRALLSRRGSVRVGEGCTVADVRLARERRGREPA